MKDNAMTPEWWKVEELFVTYSSEGKKAVTQSYTGTSTQGKANSPLEL